MVQAKVPKGQPDYMIMSSYGSYIPLELSIADEGEESELNIFWGHFIILEGANIQW